MPVSTDKIEQIHQQSQPEAQSPHDDIQWSVVTRYLAWALLMWLVGPVLFPALLIRRWAAIPVWDAHERWLSVKGAAFLSLLCYLPGILFHHQLTTLWSYLPALGESSIFLPTFDNLLFRWIIALPLVYLLAWLIEVIAPKTIWRTRRILLPGEQVIEASALAERSNKTSSKTQQQPTPRNGTARKRTGGASAKSSESSQGIQKAELQSSTAMRKSKPRKKRDSRTFWQQMPDDHPWKQEAIREAMHQAGSRQSYEPEYRAIPSSQQADYNWDDGEGTLKI